MLNQMNRKLKFNLILPLVIVTFLTNSNYAYAKKTISEILLEKAIEKGIDLVTDKFMEALHDNSSSSNSFQKSPSIQKKVSSLAKNHTYSLFVGKNEYKYKMNLELKKNPYNPNIYLVSGYLVNNEGKRFYLKECNGDETPVSVKNKKYFDCSFSYFKNTKENIYYLREGKSLWSFDLTNNAKVIDGLVFNVETGNFQASFDGYKDF